MLFFRWQSICVRTFFSIFLTLNLPLFAFNSLHRDTREWRRWKRQLSNRICVDIVWRFWNFEAFSHVLLSYCWCCWRRSAWRSRCDNGYENEKMINWMPLCRRRWPSLENCEYQCDARSLLFFADGIKIKIFKDFYLCINKLYRSTLSDFS